MVSKATCLTECTTFNLNFILFHSRVGSTLEDDSENRLRFPPLRVDVSVHRTVVVRNSSLSVPKHRHLTVLDFQKRDGICFTSFLAFLVAPRQKTINQTYLYVRCAALLCTFMLSRFPHRRQYKSHLVSFYGLRARN